MPFGMENASSAGKADPSSNVNLPARYSHKSQNANDYSGTQHGRSGQNAISASQSSSWNGNSSSNGFIPIKASEIAQNRKRHLPVSATLPYTTKMTGLCYDVRMRYHATVDEGDLHPEDPRRIWYIYKALVEAGLVEDESEGRRTVRGALYKFGAREVTKAEALLVHSEEHWANIEQTQTLSLSELQQKTREGDSIYFNNESFFCSKLSCGGAIEACRLVMDGTLKNSVAVIRPPGHHAEPCTAMGFCLFNNVAVAAKIMLQRFPETCKRVLIVDWDVHHGNGTQKAFYNDPNVLYISIHRFDRGHFYPPGLDGDLDKCGEVAGEGFNVNIPWDIGGMGDGEYLYAFQRVVIPIALEFKPDLVIVSAGFDAAAGDAIGGCIVTPEGFAHMAYMLKGLANGKIVVCLEGGYNLLSIANSALAVTKVLVGEPPGMIHSNLANASAVETVHQVVIQQAQYWDCMNVKSVLQDVVRVKTGQERLHGELALSDLFPTYNALTSITIADVIRAYQSKKMWDRYGMVTLDVRDIYEDRISESWKEGVLATENFHLKSTLVYLVHDAPKLAVKNDPHTALVELDEAFLLDPTDKFITWAASKGFGVIDANIPRYLTGVEIYVELARETERFCEYMWDNYIEVSDAKQIILISIGEAAKGLTMFLGQRAENCKRLVAAVVNFVGEGDLTAVKPAVPDDLLAEWYYQNSLIWCHKEHNVWEQRKVKKKFGNLLKAEGDTLDQIVAFQFEDTTEWIMKQLGEFIGTSSMETQ